MLVALWSHEAGKRKQRQINNLIFRVEEIEHVCERVEEKRLEQNDRLMAPRGRLLSTSPWIHNKAPSVVGL